MIYLLDADTLIFTRSCPRLIVLTLTLQAPARYGAVRHDLESTGQSIGAMNLLIARGATHRLFEYLDGHD